MKDQLKCRVTLLHSKLVDHSGLRYMWLLNGTKEEEERGAEEQWKTSFH